MGGSKSGRDLAVRGVGKGIAQGEKRWRGFVVGIERERALGAVWQLFAVALDAVEPGALVSESPGEDGFDGFIFEGDGEIVAVNGGDDLVAGGGVVAGHCVVVDVEFGEVDFEAHGLGLADEIAEAFAPGLAAAG